MHEQLARQLRELLGVPDPPPGWTRFLASVDAAYRAADEDRALLARYRALRDAPGGAGELLRLQALALDTLYDAVLLTDPAGRIVDLNPAAERMYGFSEAEAIGRTVGLWLLPDEAERLEREILAALHAEGRWRGEIRFQRKDGSRGVSETVVVPLHDAAGSRVGALGVSRDVTDRVAADARYRALFEESRDAIFIADAKGGITDANAAAEELLGVPRAGIAGVPVTRFFLHETDRQRIRDELLRAGFVRDEEVRLRRPDGETRDALLSASVRRGADGTLEGLQGILHDITARKRAEAQLAYGALHDALTGLPNRALFVDRLQAALDRVQRGATPGLAVLFLDIDRFKVVNDSLGHGTGDALLAAVARRLATALRAGDTVARFGGDEFVILLDDVATPAEAPVVAERLLDALSAPFALDAQEVFASASVGVAVATGPGEDAEEMLRNADAALSRAKVLGKGRYEVFDRGMHAEAVERLRLEGDLRRAVERGELRVHYQPIVDLASGSLCGFEALARWEHPERGIVLPRAFVPLAEETGLIRPLGRLVLEAACEQLGTWQARFGDGLEEGLSMSVNLSVRQFDEVDLAGHVRAALERYALEPRRLRLEITESVVLEHVASVTALLAELRAAGVGICMDDFGTGYASLSSLHRLPLDQVKIDRSFVRQMDRDPRSAQLVQAIVLLAHGLGVKVVAEGVETAAQLDALRRMGCDYGQGFLFSRPVPAAEAEQLLAQPALW